MSDATGRHRRPSTTPPGRQPGPPGRQQGSPGRQQGGTHRHREGAHRAHSHPGHRVGAHRAEPAGGVAPRLLATAVVLTVTGLAVTTAGPWRTSEGAQAASGAVGAVEASVAEASVAGAGFAVEPRAQAGSRGRSLLPETAVLTVGSTLAIGGRVLAVDVVEAHAAAGRSVEAGLQTTTAGTRAISASAWHEAHHPPVLDAWRTSSFGLRWGRLHRGIDYGADIGTPLYAVGAGTVTAAGWTGGLGYHVKIRLDDGTVLVYGHLSRVGVSAGQLVVAGQEVGEVGSSGSSTGAHLHFEVRVDGTAIDPDPWLADRLGDRHLPPAD